MHPVHTAAIAAARYAPMSVPVRPHRRQFVVGPRPHPVHADWVTHPLGDDLWLSACPDLRAVVTRDARGVTWALLGIAVQTVAALPDPAAHVAASASADVPGLHGSWAGRWALVGDGRVHMDACGLLGCFATVDRTGAVWASSSPALLDRLRAGRGVDPRALSYEVGLSWYPPPRSRLEGVRRLLAGQVLRLADGGVVARPLTPPIARARPPGETLELLGDALVTGMARLPRPDDGRLWLSMTAGRDSRVVAAATRAAGVEATMFTRIAARTSVADRLLPPRIAADGGWEHVVVRGGPHLCERIPLIDAHAAGHVSRRDAEPFLAGTRDGLAGIAVGGWCFEVGRALIRRTLPAQIGDPAEAARGIARRYREPSRSSGADALREWLEWVIAAPQEVDWRDRFYMEQRLGGWLAAKEQLFDLTGPERYPVVNCARTYGLMLGLPDDRLMGGAYQAELVRMLAPELAAYPFNPPAREFGRLRAARIRLSHPGELARRTGLRVRRRVRQIGLRG